MARESVDINKLTEISPTEIIDELSKENADLRLRLAVSQRVINKMITFIQESINDEEPSDQGD